LASAGNAISAYRKAYFKQLAPRFAKIMGELAPSLTGLELRYRQGWDRNQTYQEALEQSAASDLDQGYTHSGPQRADIRVMTGGHTAADTLSRGQQKLVVCGLKLAQGQLMSESSGENCAYLIDDLPSELDEVHSRLVCTLLASMQSQVFITCVDPGEIQAVWPESKDFGLFHVEQGQCNAISGPDRLRKD
jgi:DNA replication and repair protein RecF